MTRHAIIFLLAFFLTLPAAAQEKDSIATDTVAVSDSAVLTIASTDKTAAKEQKVHQKRDWKTWRPDVKKVLWYSIVLPGAGQIYNRKFWKLPIFYGGIVGCLYAMSWNGQMYKDYSQAYMDIMDNDPNTHSYDQFLHLGARIDATNENRYKEIFRKRKDRYRRYRDLSAFVLIGVYALSIIDAYVDASLSDFDISRDLSLRVQPAVVSGGAAYTSVWGNQGLGVNCCITF